MLYVLTPCVSVFGCAHVVLAVVLDVVLLLCSCCAPVVLLLCSCCAPVVLAVVLAVVLLLC